MNTLFGVPMDTVAWLTAVPFVLITAILAVMAWRNRLMFKLGLRNIPRRRAQTILIVVGLMLSTVIITSAFGTGDTMSYSIRNVAVTQLGNIDEVVTTRATANGPIGGYFPSTVAGTVRASLAKQPVDGITGAIVQQVAVQDLTSRQSKSSAELLGVPARYPAAFGALVALDGGTLSLTQLKAGEVVVNATAAQALNARAGDRLRLFVAGRPINLVVRAIATDKDLAAGGLISGSAAANPEVLLPLAALQGLIGESGQYNAVLISNQGDALSGATHTDAVVNALRAPLANRQQVTAIAAILRTPGAQAALGRLIADKSIATDTRAKLRAVASEVRAPAAGTALATHLNDGSVVDALKSMDDAAVASALSGHLDTVSSYVVQAAKQESLTSADQFGNELSTVFIVFGLFSIAAGIMLIFLIFVMLAAERRAEMGMARAVGTKRRHLIEQFMFEGYAYDLGAALVGVAIGIGVGFAMVSAIASLVGNFGFTLQPQIAPRSVVIAFSLGALVTFATVAFSSWRVSRLNIVAAIRDLPENLRIDGSIGSAFRRPGADLAAAARRLGAGQPIRALVALIAAPWHFVTAFRVFISRGPLLLAAGYLLLEMGISSKELFPFDLGISLLLIGATMLLRWALGGAGVSEQIRNRIGFTLAGLALVIFWLLPFDAIRSDLHSDVEMFFLAGMMLVLGGVWTVMYNSDLLLNGVLPLAGRLGSVSAMLRPAVRYALQNRFRTGLTLSMFSLVIFTLMVMSVLNASEGSRAFDINRDIGGYQLYAVASPANPIRDVGARVAADPALRGRIAAAGSIGQIPVTMQSRTGKGLTYQTVPLDVADNSYLRSTRYTLHGRADGFSGDAQVWQAVRTHPGDVVINGDLLRTRAGASGMIKNIYYDDVRFKPFALQVRDARSGLGTTLTVVGVIDSQSWNADQLYVSSATLAAAHLAPVSPSSYYFRLKPGQDVHQAALALGSAFLANGLDVHVALTDYNKNLALQNGLDLLLEAFMALGLVVGIAALGVIATRSVVERRQHIGVMRAIGFQRRMVQGGFLLESGFIAVTGTALGAALGLLLATQLVHFFAKSSPGLGVVIPWAQVGLIGLLALGASMLTTFAPAWQASRIFPAEALRYE